ncbi:hypothetical protein MCOR18_010116 [Pyricularia oryzae]|nr:hypothetical protein MCOR18_010116 [Pyricularia oryzae]
MSPRSTPLQLCAAYRMSLRPSLSLTSRRAFHARLAELVMADKNGRLMKRKIEVTVGDADEAYVILDKEEGFSMKRAIGEQINLSSIADPEKVPLTFYHDSRHFQHQYVPYPRLVLEGDLPRQNTTNASAATLWTWGASHCITLDGTADGKFTKA